MFTTHEVGSQKLVSYHWTPQYMRLLQRKSILTKDEITLKKKIQTTHEN